MSESKPTVGITVQIDDAALQKKLLFGIEQLTDEDCKDIAKAAMIQYLSMSSVMEKFFFKSDGYGYRNNTPTEFAERVMKVAIDDTDIKAEAAKILETLRTHRTEFLQNALSNALLARLYDHEMIALMKNQLIHEIREGN